MGSFIQTQWPIVSDVPSVQDFYVQCREAGQSHNIAEICAFRQPPVPIGTNTRFCIGMNSDPFGDDPVGRKIGEHYRKLAVAAGVNPDGKRYISQLADFPGDPKAWCADSDDVKARCREKGVGCSGSVNLKPAQYIHEHPDDQPYQVADDLVADEVASIAQECPDAVATPKMQQELTEQVRERMSGRASVDNEAEIQSLIAEE